ncbi:hypothetical protein RW115_12515 [Macrococcus capreoli]
MKFAIILGALLNPYAMSGVMFVIVLIESICYISSLFVKPQIELEEGKVTGVE